jgi:hypothetical protein
MNNCVRNGLNLNDADHKLCSELNFKIEETQEQFRFVVNQKTHRKLSYVNSPFLNKKRDTLNQANQKFGLRISDQTPLDEIPRETKRMTAVDS